MLLARLPRDWGALIAAAIPLNFRTAGWNWIGWIGVIPLTTAVAG